MCVVFSRCHFLSPSPFLRHHFGLIKGHVLCGTTNCSAAVGFCLRLATLLVVLRLELHAARGIHHCLGHRKCLLSVTLESLLSHLVESLFDAGSLHGGCLVEEHVIVLTGPLLALSRGDGPVLLLIELVTQADEGEGLRVLRSRILIEAVPPAGERIERLLVRDVVDQGATIGTAIEGVTQRLELLLSCSVPDLKGDDGVVY